jgi:hypothetical protein
MRNDVAERSIAKTIGLGSLLTTAFLFTSGVTDPVNVTKLLALGITALVGLGYLFGSRKYRELKKFKLEFIVISIFSVSAIISTVLSDSPLEQNLYGSYGRNTGLLAYVFLCALFVISLTLRDRGSFSFIIRALIWAGIVNLIYCLWVILFGDFLGWNNPYGGILGTFGNPNFIGAFLGIFLSIYFAISLDPNSTKLVRFGSFLVIPIGLIEIFESHAVQGRVVAAAGFSVALFFYLRPRLNMFLLSSYCIVVSLTGVTAVLGALQIGPLTKMIYKYSVSLRGQYWLAAWNTGNSNPVSGVGMDSFGDWYRRGRDIHALDVPGINTVTNAAHNVPLDLFAFGGWPLFLCYVGLVALSGVALMRVALRIRKYDAIFTSILVGWIGYQLQSIISINQIGLAVWGWVLMGIAIAYEYVTRESIDGEEVATQKTKKTKNSGQDEAIKLNLLAFLGALVGLLIALPPLSADAKWRTAQLSRSALKIEETMRYSYFNPQSTFKYGNNIQTLEASGLYDLSHRYAKEFVKWNPQSFDAWKLLYFVKNSTSEEKAQAVLQMKRLDPFNQNVIQN